MREPSLRLTPDRRFPHVAPAPQSNRRCTQSPLHGGESANHVRSAHKGRHATCRWTNPGRTKCALPCPGDPYLRIGTKNHLSPRSHVMNRAGGCDARSPKRNDPCHFAGGPLTSSVRPMARVFRAEALPNRRVDSVVNRRWACAPHRGKGTAPFVEIRCCAFSPRAAPFL